MERVQEGLRVSDCSKSIKGLHEYSRTTSTVTPSAFNHVLVHKAVLRSGHEAVPSKMNAKYLLQIAKQSLFS